MPRASRRAFARRRRGAFQRFSSPARQAVVRAQEEARAADAPAVEPAHLVLGLLGEEEGGAAAALAPLGVDAEGIRTALGSGPGSPPQIPFAVATKKVLEDALRESLALRHDWIGTEHLLLALASDTVFEGVGGEEAVRAAAMLAFVRAPAEAWPIPGDDRQYIVAELDGGPDDWTTRLNELAAEGWELMQVVDRRAVLRRS